MQERLSELSGYRWIVVSASALILALAMGSIVNGMSAYVVPLENLHGWDRADVSLINVSGIMGLAFGGLLMRSVADRFGTRSVVLFGSTIMGLSYQQPQWTAHVHHAACKQGCWSALVG
jgi:MFS family permease